MSLSRSDQARLNGAKSRGPKTPEGKARSSLNALKHGRYATNAIVLKNEDAAAFEDLVADYVRRIQPADPVEYHLTRELAAISWLLNRVYALDTRLLDLEMDIQAPSFDSAGMVVAELSRLSTAGRSIVDRSQYPNYLARRQAQLMRSRQSILATLKALRKSFPLAEPSTEIISPQPLNPESPAPIEPETNPPCESESESGADPQVCAGPPGPAPEQTPPEPANTLPIDSGVEFGEHVPNPNSSKSVPCVPSTEAVPGSSSDPLEQPGAGPGSSNRPATTGGRNEVTGGRPGDSSRTGTTGGRNEVTGGRPGGRAPRLKTPWGSALPSVPKAA
jgi:hypothetical protein